jgi:hypothetical protein
MLISEYDSPLLIEAKADTIKDLSKPLILEGIFATANVQNRNGRIYPRSLWERVLKDPEIIEQIRNGQMLGEAIHPTYLEPSYKEAAIKITSLRLEGDNVIGTCEVLEDLIAPDGTLISRGTPNGNIIGALARRGVKIGISSRGVGDVDENGYVIDTPDNQFKLITFDCTARASNYGSEVLQIKESMKAIVGEFLKESKKYDDNLIAKYVSKTDYLFSDQIVSPNKAKLESSSSLKEVTSSEQKKQFDFSFLYDNLEETSYSQPTNENKFNFNSNYNLTMAENKNINEATLVEKYLKEVEESKKLNETINSLKAANASLIASLKESKSANAKLQTAVKNLSKELKRYKVLQVEAANTIDLLSSKVEDTNQLLNESKYLIAKAKSAPKINEAYVSKVINRLTEALIRERKLSKHYRTKALQLQNEAIKFKNLWLITKSVFEAVRSRLKRSKLESFANYLTAPIGGYSATKPFFNGKQTFESVKSASVRLLEKSNSDGFSGYQVITSSPISSVKESNTIGTLTESNSSQSVTDVDAITSDIFNLLK